MSLNSIAMGKRIKALRKKRGYSQNSLSEMIDKTPTYISYIESGIKSMSLDTFIDLVNALNATADELLKDSLENTAIVSNHEFSDLIADCSPYELRVLLEVLTATKKSLRANKNYLSSRRF